MNDCLTFYKVNISSGPKILKGNFSLELIFTKQKVLKLKGGGVKQNKSAKCFFCFDGLPYKIIWVGFWSL